MLRARVCDPLGPRWIRSITPAVAAALIVLPPFAPGGPSFQVPAALVGVSLFFGRRMLRLRFGARGAAIRLHPGSIEIEETGALDQPVFASEIVAASTARTPGGVALALVRRGSSERPLVLDFEQPEDLDEVRRSLGLGHFGFGVVGWPTRARSTALQGSNWLAFAWLAIAASSAFDHSLLAFTLALMVLPATVVALLVACLQDPRGPRIDLTAAGVRFSELPPWTTPLRYADILDASAAPAGVVLTTEQGSIHVPMARSLPEEREHVAAQVLSAAARARGEGPAIPKLPAPVARLAPRAEAERDWLQRLDAAAASIASSDAYRGSELEPKDLWVALENPDAPPRVRAAAARVLSQVAPEEARTRVADVLACDRDAHACACIRIALEEDVETAARELEELELAARG